MESQFRLDDYSRRSACDRCRDQKLRCERPLSTDSGHRTTQCRRCTSVQVRCLTTIQSRHERNQSRTSFNISQPRKRHREDTSGSTEGSQEDQGCNVTEIETQRNSHRKDESKQVFQQHHEQQKSQFDVEDPLSLFYLNNNTLYSCDNSQRETLLVQSTGIIDPKMISFRNALSGDFNATDSFDLPSEFVDNQIGFDISNSQTTSTNSEHLEHSYETGSSIEKHIGTANLSSGETEITELGVSLNQGIEEPNPVESALDRIMILSVMLAQESNCARKHAMPGPRLKIILNKTLQQSEAYVSLLKDLKLLAYSCPNSEDPNQHLHERSNTSQFFNPPTISQALSTKSRIDTQAALQLLSCNAALLSNYSVIGSLLLRIATAQSAEKSNILPHLPEVYMDGFSGVSSSLQIKLLTQVCVHMILEIQAGLDEVRCSGSLTLASLNAFDALFGSRDSPDSQDEGNALSQQVIQLMNDVAKAFGHSLR